MNKLVVLFAGQGSQKKGMGLDVLNNFPIGKSYLDIANNALGYDLSLILNDEEKLNQTIYTQPALVFTSLLLFQALKHQVAFDYQAVAGFSVGEYSALFAAGIYSFEDILSLIKIRAQAMEDGSKRNPGGMAAVIGMEKTELFTLCTKITNEGYFVQTANINCPGQIVISGSFLGIERFKEEAPKLGARRVIPLNVSGAFHSSFMNPASLELKKQLNKFETKINRVPIYMNLDGKPLKFAELTTLMEKQIVSPVCFEETLLNLAQDGFTHFLEIGPGNVLSGFVKKTLPEAISENLNKEEDLSRVKGWLIEHGFSQ